MAEGSVHFDVRTGPGLIPEQAPARMWVEIRPAYSFVDLTVINWDVFRAFDLTTGELTVTGMQTTYLGELLVWEFKVYRWDRLSNKELVERRTKTFPVESPAGVVEYVDMLDVDPVLPPEYGPSYLAQTKAYHDAVFAALADLPEDIAAEITAQDIPGQVDSAVDALDILLRGDPGTPREVTDLTGVSFGVLDNGGYPTFIVADDVDGGPIPVAADLIFKRMTYPRVPSQTVIDLAKGMEPYLHLYTGMPKMDGVLFPFVDDINSPRPALLWFTPADDGGPLPYWMNVLKERLTEYCGWVSDSMLTAALSTKLARVTDAIYTAELDAGSLYTQERGTGDRRLITSTGTPSNPQVALDGWIIFDTTGGKMARKADGTGDVVPYQTAMTYYLAWGDSLTANYPDIGADQPNTYAAILSGLLGLGTTEDTDYYNGGRGSEHIEQIAARQGGIELRNVGTVNVPTTTTAVAVTLDKTINSYIPQGFNFLCTFGGIPGTLARASAATTYTFTRTTAGSATAVTTGTRFIPATDAHIDEFQTFAGLMNDILHDPDPAANADAIVERGLAAVQAMVDHLPAYNKRYLVLGTITRSDWLAGSVEHNIVLAYHAGLLALFGTRFVDVRSLIIENAQDIADTETITLTGPDTTPGTDLYNLAHDTLPPSFMHDATHYYGWVEAYISGWAHQRLQLKGQA